MDEKKITKHCGSCLTNLPMFNSLTDEQFELINQVRCRVKFRPGEVIFKQGTALTHVIVLNEGLVKIYLEGIDNRNLILRFARPLTIIGGPGVFTDFKNHVTTMAVEESSACFIDVKTLTDLVMLNKDFAINLLKWVNMHTLSNYEKFIELTQKGMHGRIAGALLYLHNEVFNEKNGEIIIKRQDLADLTAMSKESAIRIIKELKDENIISVDGNIILLNNIESLTNISLRG
ncbi:MAG: Crp/Fnr family transcriptional regulator [Bacteroidetes bacterium]|nr:Crp/Fnr family transcriptional regulator [Bacteroidota bacterium]